jgi:ribonuclease J
MVELCAVGGYNEVGKNCTAVKIGNEVVLLDLGINLERYITFTEDEDIINVKVEELVAAGAVPDLSCIQAWKPMVRAIIPSHAHLDHVGAIPFLAHPLKAPVICTPFTKAVISAILRDEKIKIQNELTALNPNSSCKLSDTHTVEFINITHSTPQTVMVALHTKEGIILYANDFKFDNFPTLGKTPNYSRLEELGKKGVLALIVDSTYSAEHKKMPSESVAKEMLKDVLLGTDSRNKLVVVTTFSSHLARLKSIIEFGKRLDRRILFLGRSLSKYTNAGEEAKIIQFSKEVEIARYAKQIKKRLAEVDKRRKKYLLVVTGHQGEKKSTLSKMATGQMPFRFQQGDHVVFSCTVIPTEINKKNREEMEKHLNKQGCRIFRDIHVSGHAAREDLRDLINLVKPKHIIPAHGNSQMTGALALLATEMGYSKDRLHVVKDGTKIIIR